MQEAKAVASLDHPGICPVYDAGVDTEGRAFMVMQYVQGETLAAQLKRGPLAAGEALRLCTQIAEALSAAHRTGVVHRDLKPQNIIVTPSGQPKIVDFGIAKVLALPAASDWETASALTNAYAVAGTPAYMSPEQAQQRPLDARSDLFTLGTILFQCLTGRRPFPGDTPLEVVGNIIDQPAPLVSHVQPKLGKAFDDVCQRLLAKHPDARYQTADETARAFRALSERLSSRSRRRVLAIAAAAVVVIATIASIPKWLTPALPEPPPEAQRWFTKGTEALREGSFHGAAVALEEGIKLFPNYPIAYALLAEARRELDDERGAARELVRLSNLFPNQSRLRRDDRERLDAIRALVLREVDAAVHAYGQITTRHPADASAWIDLGRAQEAAAQLKDARTSHQQAISLDRQSAAAHLRLGIVEAAEGKLDEAAKALAEAERLYRAASNAEGETEVLIRQGALYQNFARLPQASETLGRALTMAQASRNAHQVVRAQMQLSSLTASQGRLSDAERMASAAVDHALNAGLETVAADGLIDLAATLAQSGKFDAAHALVVRALALAEARGARRTAARARTQGASLNLDRNQPDAALASVLPAIEFFRAHNYRLGELDALSVAARAYQRLDDIPKARDLAMETLRLAESIKDDYVVAQTLATLAGQESSLGALPKALALRERTEKMRRDSGDSATLPFELLNRAEVLTRLGRIAEAMSAVEEVERGIAKGIDTYVGRQRRVHMLRAYAAVVTGDLHTAAAFASRIDPNSTPSESSTVLGPALLDYALAKQRGAATHRQPASSPESPTAAPMMRRERRYWIAAAHLAAGNAQDALQLASTELNGLLKENDELRWRLAALAAAAAQQLGETARYETLRSTAVEALGRLRTTWGAHARAYESRKDLTELRTAIGL